MCRLSKQRTKMGKCEPRNIYMHAMFRNPSESWSTHFTGTIYHSGYMATGAAMGNDKSNKYWEAQLPPDWDRRSFEKFIRAKYAEKRWVQKGETQAILIPGDASNIDIPRRTRNLSLEEKILTQHMAQITPPPLRSRKGSLDMSIANTPVVKKTNGADKGHSPSPSLWATFDSLSSPSSSSSDLLPSHLHLRSSFIVAPPLISSLSPLVAADQLYFAARRRRSALLRTSLPPISSASPLLAADQLCFIAPRSSPPIFFSWSSSSSARRLLLLLLLVQLNMFF
ncbi:hypothetical protein Dsin_005254 [Dipteronia sinensis]|uniref:Uncharacterized protein n=1 Tax=Dipteronia sinensis TaxID=43782 RepID=A0AAE0AWJ8_9ROSI|nr:hypothetical protein Dsin_005254 [Dipteronia sinensis]